MALALTAIVTTVIVMIYVEKWAYIKTGIFVTTLMGEPAEKAGALNRLVTGIPMTVIFLGICWLILNRTLVLCGQFEMKVVNDGFFKSDEVYGGESGGWGFKTPWSKVTATVSLEGETLSHEGTYAVSDAEWKVKFGFVITPEPRLILNYVQRGKEETEKEFLGIASGRLSSEMARNNTIGMFEVEGGKPRIERLKDNIEGYFRDKDGHVVSEFERGYGANVQEFRIESILPGEDAMASLGDSLETTAIGTMVKRLRDEFGFDFQEAVQIATLFGSKGDKARKTIIETRSKGGKGGSAIDASLAAFLAGGGHGGGEHGSHGGGSRH